MAQQTSAAPDPKAILERSSQFSRSLRTVTADMVSTVTTPQGPAAMRMMMWAELPDKLATRSEFPGGATVLYLVGNQQTTYIQKKNMYSVSQLPEGAIASQLRDFMGAGLDGNGLFAGKTGEAQFTFAGKETVSGTSCDHVRVTMPDGNVADLWIADGDQPLPVYARMKMVQPAMTSETWFRWTVNQPIPAAYFQFTPPPGATSMNAATPGKAAAPKAR